MAKKQTPKIRSKRGAASFRTRLRKRRLVHAGAQTNAARVIGPLEPGMEFYIVHVGQFHAINVIEAVIDQIGEPVNVDVSSWTIAHFEVSRLARYLKAGKAARIRFVTDRSFKNRHPDILADLDATIGRANIRMLRCHAKFVTIQNDVWHIVIRTSANLNSNPRIENYEISDDPALAAYMTEIVDEIFSIERPIGRREMNALKTIGNRSANRSREPSLIVDDPLAELSELLIGWDDEPPINMDLYGGIDEF